MRKWLYLAVVLVLMALALSAAAQSGYDLSWWNIGGGGGTSAEGDYTLAGTAGQADAGPTMGGGNYALIGGFAAAELEPVSSADQYLFLPLLTSQ